MAIYGSRRKFGKVNYSKFQRKRNKGFRRKVKKIIHGKNPDMLIYKPRIPKGMNVSPLPSQYITKFVAAGSFVTGTTANTQMNFKMNSLYLPFQNAGGVTFFGGLNVATFQCPGWANLLGATMYQKYLVSAIKFEIDLVPQGVLDSVICTISASHTGGTPASAGAAIQKPWTRSLNFSSGRTYRLGDYPLKMYTSIHEFVGLPKMLYDYDTSNQWTGTYLTDAANTLEFVCNINTGDNQALTIGVEGRVRITYYTRLFSLYQEAIP